MLQCGCEFRLQTYTELINGSSHDVNCFEGVFTCFLCGHAVDLNRFLKSLISGVNTMYDNRLDYNKIYSLKPLLKICPALQ